MSNDASRKIEDKFLTRNVERRSGDWRQEGANNTLILLGTDRAKEGGGPATVNDGLGAANKVVANKRPGAVLIVAGRVDTSGNPDLIADDAFLYLSSNTNIDNNILPSDKAYIRGGTPWGANSSVPGAVLKSTHIRLVYRNSGDVRILSDGAKSFLIMNDKFVDWSISDNFWLNVGGTKMEIQNEDNLNRIKLGPLIPSLVDLVDRLMLAIAISTTVSMTGNHGAPVPNNGQLKDEMLQALHEWKGAWIEEPYMKTFKGPQFSTP